MKVLHLLLPRVGAQAFLALANYLVSITAAHALTTGPLAAFFAAWALESTWVGAVRMVLVPALLLADRTPRLVPLLAVNVALGTPIAVAVFVVAQAGLPLSTALLLALSVWVLGGYEVARSLLSREHRSTYSIALADGAVFGTALVVTAVVAVTRGVALDAALLSVIGSALGVAMSIAFALRRINPAPRRPLWLWFKDSIQLLRLGVLEWTVFFVISVASLALLGAVGGPEILAGVRLGETIAAPIGLLGSALPFVAAGALRDEHKAEVRWPRPLTLTLGFLIAVTVLWLGTVQLVPAGVLGLLVGDHVDMARGASLGLALGAVASLFAETATLVAKKRGRIRFLSRLRVVQLVTFVPCVAVGALSGTTTGAGLGISVQQSIPATVLGFSQLRSRRHGPAGGFGLGGSSDA
ncbi:hypothetical protein GCM10009706_22520 [Curtobacterium citreum]|uniref:MFS transporter n=1 Tax=Curtobacterium citreum TaxID=2036 RepID=A0ABT2HIY9_9MICO|nr:hypothetical protein [Curtobacterium citreum]MCS6523217.1 hypothetical protein [Curtobacterium citreum]GGL83369.1 hypothetical protein GCM10009706_22520 [Curtobacterium citreum]